MRNYALLVEKINVMNDGSETINRDKNTDFLYNHIIAYFTFSNKITTFI